MTRLLPAIAAALMFTAAVPASAFGVAIDLPRLDFPPQTTPDVGQGCSNPATLTLPGCADAE